MPIHSRTLFHFTRKQYILEILKRGFQPRYCMEPLEFLMSGVASDSHEQSFAVPMSCFCDIPFSQVPTHCKIYGYYGLGLKKQWGISKQINPIIYLSSESHQLTYLRSLLQNANNLAGGRTELFKNIENKISDNLTELKKSVKNQPEPIFQHIVDTYKSCVDLSMELLQPALDFGALKFTLGQMILYLSIYTKPYSGCYRRKNFFEENYEFHAEKEWRFIPEIKKEDLTDKLKDIFPWEKYNYIFDDKTQERHPITLLRCIPKPNRINEEILFELNSMVGNRHNLSFTLDDLNYILVKTEQDVIDIKNEIELSDNWGQMEKNMLYTKLTCLENILYDY